MKDIFSKEKLMAAVENLTSKNDSCGVDGILVSECKDYFEMNGESIREQLITGKYIPNAVLMVEVLKKNGKRRQIAKYTSTDRVVLDVLKQELTPIWEGTFSQYSFAYQKDKGIQDAIQQCAKYIESGYEWVIELDIREIR